MLSCNVFLLRLRGDFEAIPAIVSTQIWYQTLIPPITGCLIPYKHSHRVTLANVYDSSYE